MEFLLKLAAFIAATAVLVTLNIWFVRFAFDSFSARALPDTIAPIQLLGTDDKDARAGQHMAGMLLGRLGKIRDETAATLDQLRSPLSDIRRIRTQDVRDVAAVELPSGLFEPVSIEMKVGGVEVGGVLSWLQRTLARENSLRLTVENSNGRAVASGAWNDGKDTLWVEVTGDAGKPIASESIVSAVAYALTQRQLAMRMGEVSALTVREFEELLSALARAAALNHQVAWGRAAESEFETLFARIDPLVARTPRWKELVYFSARLADRSGKVERALALYRDTLALLDASSQTRPDVEKRMASLSERLVPIAERPRTPEAALPAAAAAGSTWPLSALGVSSLDMSKAVRIGVLGGLPTEGTLKPDRFEVVGAGNIKTGDATMADYVRTVVQAVELVAPKARFVFSPSTAKAGLYSDSQLVSELRALADAKPDIVLITVGPLRGPVYQQVLGRMIEDKILVVLPAGNSRGEPPAFDGSPLANKLLVIASIGRKGKPSSFTQEGNSVLWAPGEAIPVQPTDRTETRDGTTYSAALAAGVAARLLAEHPGLRLERCVAVLRGSSQPVGEGGKPVVNLDAALAKATAIASQIGPVVTGSAKPNRAIPDNSVIGLVSKIELTGTGQVARLAVNVDIAHTYVGDLVVALTSPDGRKAVLHQRAGGSTQGLTREWESGSDAALAPLLGARVAGEWQLQVSDLSSLDVGKLKEWSISVETSSK